MMYMEGATRETEGFCPGCDEDTTATGTWQSNLVAIVHCDVCGYEWEDNQE